jgi:intracellular multiplication protein IcmE
MNDDLDEEIIGSEEGFDEFVQKSSPGDLLRSSPIAKIGVIVGAVGVIFGAMYMFGQKPEEVKDSMLSMGSDVSAPPGTVEASPAYVAAVEEKNEEDLDKALRTGDSTIPVPVEAPTDRLQLPEEQTETEDPLHRWRRMQEERVLRNAEQEEDVEPVTVLDSEQQNEAMKQMAESMSKQMQGILGTRNERLKFSYLSLVSDKSDGGAAATDASGGPGGDGEFDGEVEEEEPVVIIPAGEIEYGQLVIEANSDVPGPVLALMVSGPLKGSKLIGSFTVQNDYLTLTFSTLVYNGQDIDIDAIALDPETTLPGMATEVDHRYMQRILLPAAAAFVEGFADAIAQTDTASITIDTSGGGTTTTAEEQDLDTEEEVALGVKEAGEEVREIVDEMAEDVEVLVKIHAGTPIGILFTSAVTEEADEDT